MSGLLSHLVRRVLAPETSVQPPRRRRLAGPATGHAPAQEPGPTLAVQDRDGPSGPGLAVRNDAPSHPPIPDEPSEAAARKPMKKARRPTPDPPAPRPAIAVREESPPAPHPPSATPDSPRLAPAPPTAAPDSPRLAPAPPTAAPDPRRAAPDPPAAAQIRSIRVPAVAGEERAAAYVAPPTPAAPRGPTPAPATIAVPPAPVRPPRRSFRQPEFPAPAPFDLRSLPIDTAAPGPPHAPATAAPVRARRPAKPPGKEPARQEPPAGETPREKVQIRPAADRAPVVPSPSLSPSRRLPAETQAWRPALARTAPPAGTRVPGLLPKRPEVGRQAAIDGAGRQPPPPDVHITIGRVEIRAVAPAAAPAPPARPAQTPVESLADYLARRDGARR
ncbi:MAG TPA: hypothetical protein VEW71_09970 [Allosphingosinicella sp.]|nr:hypothetical protein [Allosphingosinicella sp.]